MADGNRLASVDRTSILKSVGQRWNTDEVRDELIAPRYPAGASA